MPLSYPPALRGDSKGHFRIRITGNSGTGKTTLGYQLSRILNVPFIPLDTVYWGPGWTQPTKEEFSTKVRGMLDSPECARGWIVDGGYDSKGIQWVWEEATDVIWLDPPFHTYFPSLLLRTFRRLIGVEPTCSEGCKESFRETFFSRDSIIWWCITNHSATRRKNGPKMEAMGIRLDERGEWEGKMRRLGGREEVRVWVESVREMVGKRGGD